MAREVTTDETGLATGVAYIDTTTGRENHVRARIVVLAASACESARILLNSTSSRFPQGLANSSGAVGRYLTDTTGVERERVHPEDDARRAAQRGRRRRHASLHAVVARQPHARLPARLSHRARRRAADAGRRVPRRHPPLPRHRRRRPAIAPAGYGKALKDDYRRFYGATVNFSGRGEMIPNEKSYCEIDPAVVDRWGIPVLRFHFKWTDYEYNQVRHMQQTFRALIDEMGGTALSPMPSRERGYGIEPGGRIIHEVGVTRMGHSPTTSVLNAQCQAHDVKNLFVADGGPFVTNADKNVTWTILALAMRTSEYIAERAEGGAAVTAGMRSPRPAAAAGGGAAGRRASPGPRPRRRRRARWRRRRARPSRPRRRSHRRSSRRTNTRPCACWPTSSSRATSDRAAPPTPACPSSWTSCSPRSRRLPEASRRQTAMRGGLAWLDLECQRRFDATFVALLATTSAPPCSTTSRSRRRSIRMPTRRRRPPARTGARSSPASAISPPRGSGPAGWGSTDLQFQGNRVVADWTGCPPEALAKLGVRYPDA